MSLLAEGSPGSKVQSSRGALLEIPFRFFRTLLMMLPTPPEPCCRCFAPALGLLPAAGSRSCLIGGWEVGSNRSTRSITSSLCPICSIGLSFFTSPSDTEKPSWPETQLLLQDVKNESIKLMFQFSSGDGFVFPTCAQSNEVFPFTIHGAVTSRKLCSRDSGIYIILVRINRLVWGRNNGFCCSWSVLLLLMLLYTSSSSSGSASPGGGARMEGCGRMEGHVGRREKDEVMVEERMKKDGFFLVPWPTK